ncbi:polysaccharide biosynthesis/export family protein [Sphingomonas hankyongi]|uniref:Polysaccharide biosynthesis/export family protein n=1 Tax=Sphingomonas hankyongi TaxID=2908209 RepID=A0ABT0S2T4_9SPHN|nr:polysaccharide biosynthesis/export family protein [Sphingomonas hankyongi]MCL6730107.1 polysaccharide biosynthesis/export family protein [Sphingomonas hankyongi]
MSRVESGFTSAWRFGIGSRGLLPLITFILTFGLSPAAFAQAQPQQARAEYRLNAGDTLDVFVWGEERMQREVRVLPDGTFAFPLAGTIQAEGRTAREVGTEIQSRIQSYFRAGTPEVTVSVKDTSGLRFYVVGKVRAPGSYSVGRTINALQALSLAGGPSEFANVDQAVILRETRNGQTAERVSLSDVLRGARGIEPGEQARPIPTLRSGDVLVIP